jgi:hypothetical protein
VSFLAKQGIRLGMVRVIRKAAPFAAFILGATAALTLGASASAKAVLISKAQATSYARDVNLTAADFPGSKVNKPEHEGKPPSKADKEFARCAGAVDPGRRLVDVDSATLGIGKPGKPAEVKSSVEVMPTAALAAQDFAAVRSRRGRACLAHRLPQVVEGVATSGGRFGRTTVSVLPNLLGAGKQSFGVRVSTTFTTKSVTGQEERTPVFIDEFAILAGPGEINMGALGLVHPVATATERQLLSVLYVRAQAHKL